MNAVSFCNGLAYSTDAVTGFAFWGEAYEATDPRLDGRIAVPALCRR